MDQQPKTEAAKPSTETVCPFAKLDETSQVIRRSDLVDLGQIFRDSLSPLGDLVEYMRRQLISVDRMRRLLFVLLLASCASILLAVVNLLAIKSTSKDLDRAVTRLDGLEHRVSTAGSAATRAANAAEETKVSTAALVSAQVSTMGLVAQATHQKVPILFHGAQSTPQPVTSPATIPVEATP